MLAFDQSTSDFGKLKNLSLGNPSNRGPWEFPRKSNLQGSYVRLELLTDDHIDDLWSFASAAPESFTYLRYGPFQTREQLAELISELSSREDQPFYAVL